MPHLEGWALTGSEALVPAVGRHEVLVMDHGRWQEVGRIPVHGQPVFVVARPDGRQVWVNFAFPHNDTVQVIDVPTPRGEEVWLSVRDEDRIEVYDANSLAHLTSFKSDKPSGIFFTSRASRMGM
ncbi:Cytochrome D1 heme domain protein [compost metagenome]